MRGVLGLRGGASSSAPIAVAAAAAAEEEEEEGVEENEEEEEELELGLSLRAKSLAPLKSAPRGLGCRILTAKDLPPLTSPRSSASSSSSPASASASASKRAKADNNPSPEAVGSAHPPSQMVVGWPPIRAFRMNSLVNLSNKDHTPGEANVGASKEANADFSVKDVHVPKRASSSSSSSSSSPFVKVYMDGDPIGRKVDLSAHHSYESLALSLELMFRSPTLPLSASVVVINGATASKLLDGSSEFALTYEDREGDCMLVGDVPWEMFLDNVKRLRIMRTSDAGRLAPRFHSNKSIRSIAKAGPEASSLKRR
ncbi:auxin-responsive protein IAA10-like isoform X2 [Ananas comosus]|uniref:Auxin-responsive protein n=1 Tax=Ananas comosus TaxID=4615 RepID=A0A6P5H4P1_ANACO|nr:auxin-responsive protein IAA10-like isoform X2 [Ananas comosus]